MRILKIFYILVSRAKSHQIWAEIGKVSVGEIQETEGLVYALTHE